MGYKVLGRTEDLLQGYTPRKGLEGPFVYANGQVLYYDPKEGAYWDPKTDFYMSNEEMDAVHQHLMAVISK
jgi:hypothetical protein